MCFLCMLSGLVTPRHRAGWRGGRPQGEVARAALLVQLSRRGEGGVDQPHRHVRVASRVGLRGPDAEDAGGAGGAGGAGQVQALRVQVRADQLRQSAAKVTT